MELSIDYRFINLSHREDRKISIEKNLLSKGFPIRDKRWEATHRKDLPSLGCAISHYLALADLQSRSDATHFLILEDDWRFTCTFEFLIDVVEKVTEDYPSWDVLQLSSTDSIYSPLATIGVSSKTFELVRLHKATSCAAYVVKKDYALRLSSYFASSILMHERNRDKLEKVNRNYYKKDGNLNSDYVREKVGLGLVGIDHTWGIGQLLDTFVGTGISFGYCEPLTSDISPYLTDNHDRQLSTVLSKTGKGNHGEL